MYQSFASSYFNVNASCQNNVRELRQGFLNSLKNKNNWSLIIPKLMTGFK